ncbi:MAG TPA: hypothetical protein VFO69_07370 [Allosphingosinicella sp.]|nr:hypothetical protein [Allosphingosinicella sp.]
MKKFVFAALAASTALIAVPASAQQSVSGDITITGSVGEKCLVVTGGAPSGTSFSGTIALGELSDATGKLRSDVEATFDTAAAALAIQVVCTTSNPQVSVDANAITAATATAVTGYDNSIDYQANVTFSLAPSGSKLVSNDSASAAATTDALGGRLASGATNITIDGANFRTGSATDLLVADPTYTGHILITVAPSA